MCEKLAEENKLEDVLGTEESKQHFGQGTTGINRHKQQIPKLAKLNQITPTYRKEFGHYGATAIDSPCGQILASEVSITQFLFGQCSRLQMCLLLVYVSATIPA